MNNDTREFTLGNVFRENDPSTLYRIRDGKVLFRYYPLRGSDIETFRFYAGGFAKDARHCYCYHSRLTGANPATFRALNFTYATDGESVWTMGGKIKDAHAPSFVVCDDGAYDLGNGSRVPYGFGKDRERVFYFNFDGKANWVRKASSASFISLNDGHFGKDAQFVFCEAATLPKADVAHWQKIGGSYSRDHARVYYFSRHMRDADLSTFEVVPTGRNWMQLAKDKNHHYRNDGVVTEAEFNDDLAKCGGPTK
jgi:hypothetical protein